MLIRDFKSTKIKFSDIDYVVFEFVFTIRLAIFRLKLKVLVLDTCDDVYSPIIQKIRPLI